ncbi:MAG: hypothetical protein AAF590_09155 [Pseudomonadota bacterium]
MNDIIPTTYDEWVHCITVKCKIPLTPEFVAERIAELQNKDDYKTHRFIERWGEAHYERTLGWFRQAAERSETRNV